jgi:hypothetical protein
MAGRHVLLPPLCLARWHPSEQSPGRPRQSVLRMRICRLVDHNVRLMRPSLFGFIATPEALQALTKELFDLVEKVRCLSFGDLVSPCAQVLPQWRPSHCFLKPSWHRIRLPTWQIPLVMLQPVGRVS